MRIIEGLIGRIASLIDQLIPAPQAPNERRSARVEVGPKVRLTLNFLNFRCTSTKVRKKDFTVNLTRNLRFSDNTQSSLLRGGARRAEGCHPLARTHPLARVHPSHPSVGYAATSRQGGGSRCVFTVNLRRKPRLSAHTPPTAQPLANLCCVTRPFG
jgi:hypothetical protein